ncbi:MAG: helix-turn-helix domain-containing protein [Nitrospiraceae bacterium]|nr:helix-turn-helix domain-containing protein [Nitrospiraceae bacterium]
MEKLITAEQVAEMIGVTVEVLHQWTYRGAIPHIKISKRMIRFRESEVMEWLDSKAFGPEEKKPQSQAKKRKGGKSYSRERGKRYIDEMVERTKKEVLGS